VGPMKRVASGGSCGMGHRTTPHWEVAKDTPSGEIGAFSFILHSNVTSIFAFFRATSIFAFQHKQRLREEFSCGF
jgi:cystathionine beta-lyase/cystathionine gamma-synthase